MKFAIGEPQRDPSFSEWESGWKKVWLPRSRLASSLLGLPLSILAWLLLSTLWVRPITLEVTWTSLILIPVVGSLIWIGFVPVSGVLQALAMGHFTEAKILWSKKRGVFFIEFDGVRDVPRERLIVSVIAPFAVCCVVPVLGIWLLDSEPNKLILLPFTLTLFSADDLLAAALLLSQVPRRAVVRNHGEALYWRVSVDRSP